MPSAIAAFEPAPSAANGEGLRSSGSAPNRHKQPRMSDLPLGAIAGTRVFEYRRWSDKRERGRLRAGVSTKLIYVCRSRRRLAFQPGPLQKAVTESYRASQRCSPRQPALYASKATCFVASIATDKNPSSSTPLSSSTAAPDSSGFGVSCEKCAFVRFRLPSVATLSSRIKLRGDTCEKFNARGERGS